MDEIVANLVFFSDFHTVFQGYALKIVEVLNSGQQQFVNTLVLENFCKVLRLMQIGAAKLKEKQRMATWRLCLYVLGQGGQKLKSLIQKSESYVKGVNMSYLDDKQGSSGVF